MSQAIQSVLARQTTGLETRGLRHPVKTGYGKAGRNKRPLIDTEINPKEMPTFPSLDYMPTESSALNNVVMTDESFRIDTNLTTAPQRKALYYQTEVAALHGFRTPRAEMDSMPAMYEAPLKPTFRVGNATLNKNIASAEYGLRDLDEKVLERVEMLGRGTRGNLNRMRAWGRERDANKSIHDYNDLGLERKSKAAKPASHAVAPNHKKIKPVLAAAPNA